MSDNRIDRFVIFKMELVIKRYRQAAMKILRDQNSGITLDQWIVLNQIGENNGASQVEIAKSTIKDAPTTTRIIEQLSSKKLVEKKLDPGDRRKYQVSLTRNGLQLIERLLPLIKQNRDRCLNDFSMAEISQLEGFLNRLLANLEEL